jgi:hypothetical protein
VIPEQKQVLNASENIIPNHGGNFTIKDKHAASNALNESYKNKQKYRSSYTYASSVGRFQER